MPTTLISPLLYLRPRLPKSASRFHFRPTICWKANNLLADSLIRGSASPRLLFLPADWPESAGICWQIIGGVFEAFWGVFTLVDYLKRQICQQKVSARGESSLTSAQIWLSENRPSKPSDPCAQNLRRFR